MTEPRMTQPKLHILHLEDSRLDAELIHERLVSSGFSVQVDVVATEPEFTAHLVATSYDLILADYALPTFDAPTALGIKTSIRPHVPFIAVSGAIGEERAVDLLKQGATDYVLKTSLEKLPLAVERALDEVHGRRARRRAEDALRRLNRELRAITRCTETVMRAGDEDALLLEICRIVCKEAGYRMAWVGYATPDEADAIRPVAWAGVDAKYFEQEGESRSAPQRAEWPSTIALRTGQPAWIEDIAQDPRAADWRYAALGRGYRSTIALPLKDEQGHAFGVLGINADAPSAFTPDEVRILEELANDLAFGVAVIRARAHRDRAERALVESESKLRSILDSVGIGVCLVSPGLRVLELNAQLREWYPGVETRTRPSYEDVFGEQPQAPPAARTLVDGRMHEWATRREGDAGPRDFRIVSSPVFDATGRVVAAIEMVEDITDRLQLEAQCRHAQKMDAVGRLAGGVAHDFNNALNVILGNCELGLGECDADEGLLECFYEIRDAAERSAALTRQLLAFARKQAVSPRRLDLNRSVEDMLRMLRRLIGEDVELAWIPAAREAPVEMDPSQVDQILANLCVNARDAMRGHGKLSIELAVVSHARGSARDVEAPREYVLMSVSDDGCGMDEATIARAFEPFFTTKPVGEGTGLGLATVYGIVTQAGGLLEVSSEVGGGTRFDVYLPKATDAREIDGVLERHEGLPRGAETVLVVEDDRANLLTVRRLLAQLGYRVFAAATPSEAMRIFDARASEIDLLLTDVRMPGMSGPELAGYIAARRPSLPCLYMSGYAGLVSSEIGGAWAGVRILEKPFSAARLAGRVREALEPAKPTPA